MGAADSPAPGRSGHASSRRKPRSRGQGEAEASPAEAHPPRRLRAQRRVQRGALPRPRSPPHRGARLSLYKGLAGKCPAGTPRWGRAPSGPAPARRLRTTCVLVPDSLGSHFRPASRGPQGTPIGARRTGPSTPLLRSGLVRPRTHGPMAPGPRPLPKRGRAAAPSCRRAPRGPRPLRARSSARPPPPVTCAARMWLGADVGSRCGPGPAHPRGRAAHTEPRRARLLSRLPQCTARLRPRLSAVVRNVAARHP